MKKSIILGILAALGLSAIVVGIVLTQSGQAPADESDQMQSAQQSSESVESIDKSSDDTQNKAADSEATESVTIVYTDSGFAKSSYAVKRGQTVVVQNQSSDPLEFASGNHPTHTLNTELNLEAISPGGEASLTLTRVGTWEVHDHMRSDHITELVVVE